MITSQLIHFAILGAISTSIALALPDTLNSQSLEACSTNVASCKGKLIKHKLHDFCKADLALYKKNGCTFKTNSIGRISLPPAISQFAQSTVLQACADYLKTSIPTCAPVVTTPTGIQNDCFSKTNYLPKDPNDLKLCHSCACSYVSGETNGPSNITNPMAIRCIYDSNNSKDYIRLSPLIDFSGQTDSTYPFRFDVFAANGGIRSSDGKAANNAIGDNDAVLATIGSCTSTSDCSVVVGSKGSDSPSSSEGPDVSTVTVSGGYNGGASSTGGGSASGGASYISLGPTSTQPTMDSILIVMGGGAGISAQDGDSSFDHNEGSFLQGGPGTNGGGAGSPGYYSGAGGKDSTTPGNSGASHKRENNDAQSVVSAEVKGPLVGVSAGTGNGRIYITIGCVGSPRQR